MRKRMTRQRSMVDLDIQVKLSPQIVGTQKADNRRTVIIVLMLGRLTRLGLNKESTLETLPARIFLRGVQKTGQVLLLPLHIGIEQTHITFPSSPEYVIFPSQGNGSVQRCFHLRARMGQHMEVRIGSRSIHISPVAKEIGRAR